MIDSITYFQTKVVEKLEKIFLLYSADMTKIAELVEGVTDCMIELGLHLLAEELEQYNAFLCEKPNCRKDWHMVRTDETTLLTSLGTLCYHKTLFRNKTTGEYEYFLDRAMGLQPHTRLTEDAQAALLSEAVETSYEKGGKRVSIGKEEVSKETVKNKIHGLEFPKRAKVDSSEKKVVEYLYVDADEDHVSLQFREKKGDILENEMQQKNNHAIIKLIYVYEGIEAEAPESKRHRLQNPYYFCRVCDGKENQALWEEVYQYLEETYELSQVKKVYLNADGGSWILSGKKQLAGITYVLDEFHLKKYIRKISGCFGKRKEEIEEELIGRIKKGTKKALAERIEELEEELSDTSKKKRLEQGKEYLLSNFTAAKLRLLRKNGVIGSSTESHVSHVLSSRMSSRPMGWSRQGMAKMAELRAYYYNGGDMLELVRYQKKKKLQTVESKEVVYSSSQMWKEERKRQKELGQLADIPIYSIPYVQIKKIANFKGQIFGL